MILRRPYAFLIKHFRLIHLIITGLFAYVAYRNRAVYKFLKEVIVDSANKYNANEFINYNIYIFIVIALILCGIVYWLLKFKDKPRKIYIFAIVGYAIIGVFMMAVYGYMHEFANSAIDQKTIRLYKDLLNISLWLQYYIVIFMLIRGLGFDIKRFDFRRDVQELNLGAEDAEEVEVNINVDTTNIVRGVRKQRRELGYFFQEFKVYIITILLFAIGIGGYKLYQYYSVKYKVYNENDTIGNIYNIVVKDSYYMIDEDNNYVIINFDALKFGKKERLNLANMTLIVGDNSYVVDKNICYQFKKVGNCYKKQYLNDEFTNYIVVYPVDNLNIQEAYLLYKESYEESYKVKLIMKEY